MILAEQLLKTIQGVTYRAKVKVMLILFFGLCMYSLEKTDLVFETIALTYLFQDSTYQWKWESQITNTGNQGNQSSTYVPALRYAGAVIPLAHACYRKGRGNIIRKWRPTLQPVAPGFCSLVPRPHLPNDRKSGRRAWYILARD